MLSNLKVKAITGPTGCGKTQTAKSLALNYQAPIIVADRIQCFTDIPVTSARVCDIQDISYNYIDDRTIADGDYLAEEAFAVLINRIESLATNHRLIVLEGGSISLLTLLAKNKAQLPFNLSVKIIPIGTRGKHWQRLCLRARNMLSPTDTQAGMLQEFSYAWSHVKQREFVANINGFEAVLAWCKRNNVNPAEVGRQPLTERAITELVTEIANAHMDHSLEQEKAMENLFGKSTTHHLTAMAETVEQNHEGNSISIPKKLNATTDQKKPRVTVYCGSRPGASPAYTKAAEQLGKALANTGIELVYGGGNIGLMGTLANSVLANGGTVYGVIPQPMVDYELAHTGLTTIHITDDMHQRKAIMAKLGDAFIALPGGIGTTEELLEVLTWRQLGLHRKPCVLFNVEDFFTPLTTVLNHFVTTQFMSPLDSEHVIVCTDSVSVIDSVKQVITQIPPIDSLKNMPSELGI
jgi:uncharacterized protein (TIGR00730 family)